jgi:hypothetical protein
MPRRNTTGGAFLRTYVLTINDAAITKLNVRGQLAAGAGDAVLSVHVLTSQSLLFAEMASANCGRDLAGQALQLAFQAQEEGRYVPLPQLHALIALRHASAAALLGDRTAFQSGITQARRELDRGPRAGDLPEWLRFVDEIEITAVEARGYLSLGDADHSVRLYRQALGVGLGPRSRAGYGAELAVALLRQGARGEAVAAAMEVLPALEAGVTYTWCLEQLRLVRQAAGTAEPRTQEFRERFDVIDRTPAASFDLPGDVPQATALPTVFPHESGAAAHAG